MFAGFAVPLVDEDQKSGFPLWLSLESHQLLEQRPRAPSACRQVGAITIWDNRKLYNYR